jgi:endonuclease/exonuclease/phosphatase (EEP) superfamily protein YafD
VQLTLTVAGSALILITVLSTVRSTLWWVRAMDFPRSQVAVLLAVVLPANVYWGANLIGGTLSFGIAASLAYQCARIFPYTRLSSRQVLAARSADKASSIRLLASNVLMENRRTADFVALVKELDPDLILAVETDAWWDEQLQGLVADYPHVIRHPQGNHYGMHLFSRLVLEKSQVRFLVEDGVPSIRATVKLRSGSSVEFFGLHPRPPEPSHDTDERDAELLLVGREVAKCGAPAIVAGDLNDVAWSNTTRLFQKISGLLDPRRGRGMFSTFHAGYPMFRWPLDHIFHSKEFTLLRLRRLRSIGSDHFPILAELQMEPQAARDQAVPHADQSDVVDAELRISNGLSQ